MLKQLIAPAIILLAIFISSCQKEITFTTTDPEATPDAMITRSVIKEGDSLLFLTYVYDSQKRLVSVIDSNNNDHQRSQLHFVYNAQGRFDSVAYIGAPVPISYLFLYNSKGQIVQRREPYTSSNPNPIRNKYGYDAAGRLIADSIINYWSNEAFRVYSYSWDNNGNITESKTFDNNNGSFQLVQSRQFLYDNKPNPYYSIGKVLYFLGERMNGGEYLLTRNNLTKKTFANGEYLTYTYQYNSNGFPKSYTEIYSADPLETVYELYY